KEAFIWKQLDHPHVLPFRGLNGLALRDEGLAKLCMVSPWMENGNLKSFIGTHKNPDTKLRLALEIAEGVEYLHSRNVVHGDLRGCNVLIDADGHAKITDFGLSIMISNSVQTKASVAGAQRWMAPELLAQEDPQFSKASDAWSFACVCIELYNITYPYNKIHRDAGVIAAHGRRQPPADSLDGAPNQVQQVVQQCWGFSPTERPSMEDVITALHAAS
ncbi:kinase-like protein, partial [Punctularia strigosozonata HHB-11173 SS5]|uniref:kinase-like protein n=1 Tax=Punctularia strigosozonata (strain HHB-11173) TaxID=741275 RepID=UPI000441830A